LAATDSAVDVKNLLAGEQALCSANPYLVLKIGNADSEEDSMQKNVKLINDREHAVEK
jgi:hypothetical protein